ncbi:hypothetical protein HLB03_07735 [Acidianus sp. DSM 29099]|nr:hypothetical protein [Acidianus sp. RZ1]
MLYQTKFPRFTHLINYSKIPAYTLVGTRICSNCTLFLQVTRVTRHL